MPLTDSENLSYIASDTNVKNSVECGSVAQKVSLFNFFITICQHTATGMYFN